MVHLTEEQKQFFKDNGYIVLKNLIPEKELNEVCDEYDKLFARQNQDVMENSWVGSDVNNRQVENNPVTVRGIHNLQQHHAIFGRFLYNDDVLDAVEDVMETKNFMLHHTKAHYKPPGKGARYPMHQDYPYFPFKKHSPLAVFIHLDDTTPENGGLLVFPGSHKLGPLEDVGFRECNFHYVDQSKFPFEKATPVIARRGDIVLFSYLLVHGSTPNTSPRPRRMFLVQYIDVDDEPVGDQAVQPGYGWVMRGMNIHKNAAIGKRHDYK